MTTRATWNWAVSFPAPSRWPTGRTWWPPSPGRCGTRTNRPTGRGLDYGVAMLRIRGRTWRVAMDVETFLGTPLLREATA